MKSATAYKRLTFQLFQKQQYCFAPLTQCKAGAPLAQNYYKQKKAVQHQCRNFHYSPKLFAKQRSPYDVLGVSQDASKEDIKKKFKELAKKYHPDVCKDEDAKEKFAELNNAYQILTDDNKRKMYDMTGDANAAEGYGGGPQGGPGGPFSHEQAEEIFSHFFGAGGPFGGSFRSAFGEDPFDMFGGGGQRGARERMRNQPMQGETSRRSITVTLREAVFGTKKEIRVNKATNCEVCGGKAVNPKTKPKKCHICNGTGMNTMREGMFVMQMPCQTCHGTGKISEPCKPCNGVGYTREMKTFEVTIPEGADSGQMLKLRGLGEPGVNGGPAGDLLLDIHIERDPHFRRKGMHLETDTEIPFHTAILGGDIQVQTLGGDFVTAKVPHGTQPNENIVLRGKGVKAKDGHGDLIVYLKIKIPKTISEEQKKLIENFAATDNENNYKVESKTSSFWKLFNKKQ